MLCIVDPRLIPRHTDCLTRDLQALDLWVFPSRTVDMRVNVGHADIGPTLLPLHHAIWMIRTGEIKCNGFEDMCANTEQFCRRANFARKFCLDVPRLTGQQIAYIRLLTFKKILGTTYECTSKNYEMNSRRQ